MLQFVKHKMKFENVLEEEKHLLNSSKINSNLY